MNSAISQQLYESAIAMLYFSGPILAIAALVGFIIALFQAATQIQDQALPAIAKIFTISAVVVFMGASLASPLIAFSQNLFINFPAMVK